MTAINDWPLNKCLLLSVILFAALLGLTGLDALGIGIPVLRQLIGFCFLSFIPGLLLLRILRVHNIHIIEGLLYAVGLSLAFDMAMGLIANFALPPLGISRPIALLPLLLIITPAFLLLCLLSAQKRHCEGPAGDEAILPTTADREAAQPKTSLRVRRAWQSVRANPAPCLLAILLPLLAILGAGLVNVYHNNVLIYVLYLTIALIIGLAAFNKFIPPSVYPFMIFMLSLALLYQTTLISGYLVGSDIHQERYWAWLVLENGWWNAAAPFNINSCLSIVILAPAYSLLLDMDIVGLFKIVYPFLFALVPLALFRVLSLQVKPLYAFLSVVFFITMPMFTMDMTQLIRQQVSELFFVLLILLMVERRLSMVQRAVMVFIFSCGVVVSYYGLGTGYVIGFLAIGALALICIKSRAGRAIWQWLIGKSNPLPSDLAAPGAFNKRALALIVCAGLIFMFVYYGNVASGAALSGAGIFTGMFRTEAVQSLITATPVSNPVAGEYLVQAALGFDFAAASAGGKIWRILQYLVQLFIIVGCLCLVFRPAAPGKWKSEYIALTIISLLILLSIFIMPIRSYQMGATRIWQITLLLISPLFIFGGEAIANGIAMLIRASRQGFSSLKTSYTGPALLRFPVLLVMIPYFIFNSGMVFEFIQGRTTGFIDMPYSIAMSGGRLDINTVFSGQDVAAANWLTNAAKDDYPVYADVHGVLAFPGYWGDTTGFYGTSGNPMIRQLPADAGNISPPCYIYLRAWNAGNRVITFATAYASRQSTGFADIPGLSQLTGNGKRIYANGGAQALLP